MSEPTATEQPPPLYEGHELPVDKLDPGKFEDFGFSQRTGPAIAIAEAQTGPAQRVLNVWQTEALGRRIGLGTELMPVAAAAQ